MSTTGELKASERSPDPDNGLNVEGAKKYEKERVQNGDPRAYAHQDQRAMPMHVPGAMGPNEAVDYIPPLSGEQSKAEQKNSLAGPEGNRNDAVTAVIQKGQDRHLDNPEGRINPTDKGRTRKVK